MSEGLKGISASNMTNFFNRELFMYSLGDISFKKPVSLKRAGYTMLGILVWSVPMFFIVGLILNPFYFALLLAPPIIFGIYSTKPVFNGKTLPDFLKTLIKYTTESKAWTDLNSAKTFGEDMYYIDQEIWVGRRRELQILADLKEQSFEKKKRK